MSGVISINNTKAIRAHIINKYSSNIDIETGYCIAFLSESDTILEFFVNDSLGEKLNEGDFGTLSYFDNYFIGFDLSLQSFITEPNQLQLFNAIADNNLCLTKQLLDEGADANTSNNFEIFPLQMAIENDCIEMVQLLLDYGCQCNIKWHSDLSPLFTAFFNRNQDIVKLLIQNGMQLNITTRNGETPLHYAIYQKDFKLLKWLISMGADVNLGNDTESGPPIISVVPSRLTASALDMILKEVICDLENSKLSLDLSILDFALKYHPEREYIRILVEAGADITAKCSNGITANSLLNVFKRNVLHKTKIHLENKKTNEDSV